MKDLIILILLIAGLCAQAKPVLEAEYVSLSSECGMEYRDADFHTLADF